MPVLPGLKKIGNRYYNPETGEIISYRQALNLGARAHGFANHNQLVKALKSVTITSEQGFRSVEYRAKTIDPLAAHRYLYSQGYLTRSGISNIRLATSSRGYSTRAIFSAEQDYIERSFGEMVETSDTEGELQAALLAGEPLDTVITDYL